ncbi:hypothetical protein HK104_006782 [Borealophlyctis nickersoniae]|nr:hypothetical protein HK104_006782 [Borealophlyctis nickersoniae]
MDPRTPQEPRRSARLNPHPPNPVVPVDPDNPAAPTEYQHFRAAEEDGRAPATAETQAASDAAAGMNRGEEDLEAARVAAEVVRAGAVSAQQQEDGSQVRGEGVGDDGGASGGLDVAYDEEWPDETMQWMQALEFMRQEMEMKLEQQRRDLSTQTQHMMDVQTERMMSAQTNLIRNMFAELRMGTDTAVSDAATAIDAVAASNTTGITATSDAAVSGIVDTVPANVAATALIANESISRNIGTTAANAALSKTILADRVASLDIHLRDGCIL